MKKTAVLFLLFFAVQLVAQDLKKSALEHFNKQEYTEASKNYKKFLKKNEGDSSDWYNLAYSQMKTEKFEDAIKNFEEARKRNFFASYIDYNISKSYALQKDEKNMISALNKGAENGLAAFATLKSDAAFAEYQNSSSFKSVLEKIKGNAYPCLNNKINRHFDFWIGEWDVYVGNNKVGVNKITRAVGGCAIHENYTTNGNYAGQSINFYSPFDKKWHQHWVGSAGDVYNYVETKREDGMLQFESDFITQNGKKAISRLTFTLNADGSVQQLFQTSYDGGKTFSDGFNGNYRKRKEG